MQIAMMQADLAATQDEDEIAAKRVVRDATTTSSTERSDRTSSRPDEGARE